MYWLAVVALLILIYAWWSARRLVWATSLKPAWGWAGFACLVWSAVVVLSRYGSAWVDHIAYSGVICCLTPAVAILGARRPGIGAWNFFVVLPMVVVLHWPAVSQAAAGSFDSTFELPTPMMLGVILVTIMGLGNYFGTRFTLPSILFAAGLFLVLRTLSQPDTSRDPGLDRIVPIASLLLSAAAGLFVLRSRSLRTNAESEGELNTRVNRMWSDFQEVFGIVWAKRVMDRLNQFAQREKWDARFELTGLEPTSEGGQISPAAVGRIRWVMRRFADPEWLDARLGKSEAIPENAEQSSPESRQTPEPNDVT